MNFVIRTIVLSIVTICTLCVLKIIFVKFPGNDTSELFGSEIMGTGLNLIGFMFGYALLALLVIIWTLLLRWGAKE